MFCRGRNGLPGLAVDNSGKISEAIVRFVATGWSAAVEQDIRDAYSDEIAKQVRSVYEAAMDCPVDWNAKGMDMNSALAILADFMATELAWLSPPAKTRLNYCYIMVWK